jgi:hypothetical protein
VSAYDNDARVWNRNGCSNVFFVNWGPGQDGPRAKVREFLDTGRWVVWPDDDDAEGEWVDFCTADEAIRSLIGEPQ